MMLLLPQYGAPSSQCDQESETLLEVLVTSEQIILKTANAESMNCMLMWCLHNVE